MDFTVRKMTASDRRVWAEMRAALWPEDSVSAHAEDIEELIRAEDAWGFIAQTADSAPVGFAEVAIRKYANGCETRPVPFLEGIWVRAEFRRQGVGTRLIRHVEAFVVERGFREIGSDARLENSVSHASHLGWGFSETERVVYFRKPLNPQVR